MSTQNILLLGATGYLGGTLLAPFRRAFPDHKIVCTVRSEKHTNAIRAAGADEVTLASFEDLDQMKAHASKADVVINGADADNLALVKALLEGLKIKAKTSQTKPVYIHSSGTGVVFERPDGTFVDSKEYDDTSEADIRDINPNAMHRHVDLEVFNADSEGIVAGYIICPPAIYGVGTGPGHKTATQIPVIVRDALRRKRAAHVGPGENIWDFVHIEDVADLYVLVAKRALSPDAAQDTTPYSKFYFVNAARHSWGDVTRQVGDILFSRKLIKAPGAISVSIQPPKDLSVPLSEETLLLYTASTARTISARAHRLGWKPTRLSLNEGLEADIDAILKEIGV